MKLKSSLVPLVVRAPDSTSGGSQIITWTCRLCQMSVQLRQGYTPDKMLGGPCPRTSNGWHNYQIS